MFQTDEKPNVNMVNLESSSYNGTPTLTLENNFAFEFWGNILKICRPEPGLNLSVVLILMNAPQQ